MAQRTRPSPGRQLGTPAGAPAALALALHLLVGCATEDGLDPTLGGPEPDAGTAGSSPEPRAGNGGSAGTGGSGGAPGGHGHGSAGSGEAGTGAAGSGPMGPDPAPGGTGAGFEQQIHPMFLTSCSTCHAGMTGELTPYQGSGPGEFAREELDAAYAAVLRYVVPGDPDASKLYIKLAQEMPSTGGNRMPPLLPWPDEQIEAVRDWIAKGAPRD